MPKFLFLRRKIYRDAVKGIRKFFLPLLAFNVPGSPLKKTINLLIALRCHSNTKRYISRIGIPPDYISPECWSDKMQWRKLYDRNPLLTTFSDKVAVREYVEKVAPEIEFPKFLWVGNQVDSIPFDTFDKPYVVKSSNSSGDLIFVMEPDKVDRKKTIAICREWIRTSLGRRMKRREWGHENARTQILVEEFLAHPGDPNPVTNYKFFVFAGTVKYVQVETKKSDGHFRTFLNREGERLPYRKWLGRLSYEKMPPPLQSLDLPENFNDMVMASERLGKSIDHLRVDLYPIEGRIFFSELTPYDGSGYSFLFGENEQFTGYPPQTLNREFGSFWELPALTRREWLLRTLFG